MTGTGKTNNRVINVNRSITQSVKINKQNSTKPKTTVEIIQAVQKKLIPNKIYFLLQK